MTVIETDLSSRIMQVMLGLGAVDCEIFVADGLGSLWVSADAAAGVNLVMGEQTILDLPEAVVNAIAKKGEPFRISCENEYVAERFYVDPEGRGVTIFARLPRL